MFLYRSPVSGKRVEMSLGPTSLVSVTQAKALTLKHRVALLEGRCPLTERRAQQAALRAQRPAKVPSFHDAFRFCLAAHESGWGTKNRVQWTNSIEVYAYPVLRDLPVNHIGTAEVMLVLEPIWHTKPETASRVRQRIEKVLDYCAARHWRTGDNPARWRGHISTLLPSPEKVRPLQHFAALDWHELPALYQALAEHQDVSALALRYVLLTAMRTGEVLGATPDEIDQATRTHVVPARRMKAGKEHRAPLSAEALRVLAQAAGIRTGPTIFCGARAGQLSDMALLMKLRGLYPERRVTTHGMRSAFRDWCSEHGVPRELAERQLAHTVRDATEAAYLRTDVLDPRRVLMERWAQFLTAPADDDQRVVPIRREAVGAG
jgi:integrase